MPANQTPDGFQAPPGTEAEHIAVVNDGFVPPFQVDRGPIARSAWDAQHETVMGDGSTPRVTADTAHVFATLRDIADAEPVAIVGPHGEAFRMCAMCGAESSASIVGGVQEPMPHLISCPWARATQIVGVKADG